MNISTDWLLEVKKKIAFATGYVTAEVMAAYGELCFRLGAQWMYKWRNFLIEQPHHRDIVVINDDDKNRFIVCQYLADTKQLYEINTRRLINVHSKTKWKLVQTTERLDMFDYNRLKPKDPCSPCEGN